MVNRYWMSATDLMDEDTPIRDTDIVDRLNEQDEDITILRSQRADLLAACEATQEFLTLLKGTSHESDYVFFGKMNGITIDKISAALAKARGETPAPAPRKGEYLIPVGTRDGACRSCGAPVLWITTAKGSAMPLSVATIEERGGERYALSHFSDCPQGKGWSKKSR